MSRSVFCPAILLPLSDLSALQFELSRAFAEGPTFYRGTLREEGRPCDTFLELEGWTKGVAWFNGFNLGRYWSRRPQRRLYIPGPLLREGGNELVVFELHGTASAEVRLCDGPDLG